MTETLPAKTGASMRRHQSKQDYVTPMDFVRALEKLLRVRFTIDLAATEENTRVEGNYFTKEQNSLIQPWRDQGEDAIGWLNPEFGDMRTWAHKCEIEGTPLKTQPAFRSAMLGPASVGANWYADHVHHKAMVLSVGRIQFIGCPDPYPKDLMVALFGFGFTGFDVWKWK
jgi:hypothetical protein